MTTLEKITARDAAYFGRKKKPSDCDSWHGAAEDRRWLLGVVRLAEPVLTDRKARGHAPACVRFERFKMDGCNCGYENARKALALLTADDEGTT